MVDVETEVYSACAEAVLAEWPGAFTTNKHEAVPPQWPAVEIMETGNVEASYLHDSSGRENGSIVEWTVNAYSNLRSGAKAQVKEIAQLVDVQMRSMGFERTFGQFVQNADSSVYRYTTRYTGVVKPNDSSTYRRY